MGSWDCQKIGVTISLVCALSACEDEVIRVAENAAPTAKISVADEVGRNDLVRFDGTESFDPDGVIVKYDWSFGDGTANSTTAVSFHTYNELGTYEVELVVTDNRGESAKDTKTISVDALPTNQPPVAQITAPSTADPGVAFTLDASSSFDPDGMIESYDWKISGGVVFRGVTASHTFSTPGTYDVELTVTDNRGSHATATQTIQVGVPTGNLPPVANAGLDIEVGVGATVTLDGTASFDPDGQVVSYEWDFGDGTFGAGATTTHVYNTQATFSVTLTVTDNGGLSSDHTINVLVGVVTVDGTYTMEANPSTGSCGGLPAQFVATTVTFAAQGATLHADQPDPENPAAPPIRMSGMITGPSFSVTGPWVDSSGADHTMTLTGQFSGSSYSGQFQESISFLGSPLCVMNWNVTGEKI